MILHTLSFSTEKQICSLMLCPTQLFSCKNDNLQILLFVCLTVLFMSIFMFYCVFFCARIMCYPLGQILLFVLPRAVFVVVFRAN